jgi:hypothetical protein
MERAKRVPAKRSLIGNNDVLLQRHPRIRTKSLAPSGSLSIIARRVSLHSTAATGKNEPLGVFQRPNTASVRSASASSRLQSLSYALSLGKCHV